MSSFVIKHVAGHAVCFWGEEVICLFCFVFPERPLIWDACNFGCPIWDVSGLRCQRCQSSVIPVDFSEGWGCSALAKIRPKVFSTGMPQISVCVHWSCHCELRV